MWTFTKSEKWVPPAKMTPSLGGTGPVLETDVVRFGSSLRDAEDRIGCQKRIALRGAIERCLKRGHGIPAMPEASSCLSIIGDGEIVGFIRPLNREERSGLGENLGRGDQALEVAGSVDDEVDAGRARRSLLRHRT